MNKWILTLGLLCLLVGAFILTKFYSTPARIQKKKSETWNKRINQFKSELHDGDIIFHTSTSNQSKAIQFATRSKYSHCGLIYKKDNNIYVFEAIEPVKFTPLNEWIARGLDGKFIVKRLKNAANVLTPSTLGKMKGEGQQFLGKHYDQTFDWSDDQIYCSELIWKIYKRSTGLEIGKLEKLRDFDLKHKVVQTKMKERYGDKIPMDEIVISPAAIFDNKLLITVASNE